MMEVFYFLKGFGQCLIRMACAYYDFHAHPFGTDKGDAGVIASLDDREDACQFFFAEVVDVYHDVSQIFNEVHFGTPSSVAGGEGDCRQFFFLLIGSLFSLLCKDAAYFFDFFPVGKTADSGHYFFFGHFCYCVVETLKYGEMFHFYFDYCLSMQRNFFAEMCKGTLYKMAISYYGSPKKCMIVATCFGERRRLRARYPSCSSSCRRGRL